jgi:magnesium chelatase family protein
VLLGPPGAGKSMLARWLTTILPEMTVAEAIDTTRMPRRRHGEPVLCPHYPISDAGPIGGGQVPMPGDVSLAHHGMLLLDARPEFRRHVLEVLRQPLEKSIIYI